MGKSLVEAVSAERRLLANPYAHIDYLEELRESADQHSKTPVPVPSLGSSSSRYSDTEIERLARQMQHKLWHASADGRKLGSAEDPIEVLDPERALSFIGYEVTLEDGLGQYRAASGLIEVAGLIDNKNRSVQLSGQFPRWVRRFTAAHELGHAVLHTSMKLVHRDKPLDGVSIDRDPIEREADRFASFFLMPSKLLTKRFRESFSTSRFVVTEESAFALLGVSGAELVRAIPTRRHLSRALANTTRYNGRHFVSLADQFGVSDIALAIRLEELGLVA